MHSCGCICAGADTGASASKGVYTDVSTAAPVGSWFGLKGPITRAQWRRTSSQYHSRRTHMWRAASATSATRPAAPAPRAYWAATSAAPVGPQRSPPGRSSFSGGLCYAGRDFMPAAIRMQGEHGTQRPASRLLAQAAVA